MTDGVRTALIGVGMVADMHADAIANTRNQVVLTGALSRSADRAASFARKHACPGHYSTIDDLIADAPDFVIVATPPDARHDIARALVAARIPVLMEKPLERDLARARTLVEMFEAAHLPLGVVLQHRMRPAARELLDRVQAGALGQIGTVDLRVPWWREQSYYDTPGRGTFARDGGGVLITQAIHTIDLMLQATGPVASVQAMTATSPLHRLEAEDFAAAALRFANGATGALMASVTHRPGDAESLTLNGTRASATLTANQLLWHPADGPPETLGETTATGSGADPMAFSSDWHRHVISDFALAIREGRMPAITGRSALPAQALIDAIQRSATSGQSEAVEETGAEC